MLNQGKREVPQRVWSWGHSWEKGKDDRKGGRRLPEKGGDRAVLKENLGAELVVAPDRDNREPSGWVEGTKVTYRRAEVTPPPRAAGPRARGSYESSSPGSASRSLSASAFRPRRGGRPGATSTSGVTGEDTGRKSKSGWRRREPVLQARSRTSGGGPGEALAPPLKGLSAAALRVLKWDPRRLRHWKRSKWALQQCLRTGGRVSGSSGCILGLVPRPGDRGKPPSQSFSLAVKTRERRGATALIPCCNEDRGPFVSCGGGAEGRTPRAWPRPVPPTLPLSSHQPSPPPPRPRPRPRA